jgi:hypothetical protein
LETPRSDIYLKRGDTLDKYARKGVDQIDDWRDWLKNQISIAQAPRIKGGLGLPDISNQSLGLVIVGRRGRRPKNITDAKRNALRERGIQVHSYDWFLEHLRGAVGFDGPYSSNPYLIQLPIEERLRKGRRH